jgi:DNA polymerase-3 subunit gamma/tau
VAAAAAIRVQPLKVSEPSPWEDEAPWVDSDMRPAGASVTALRAASAAPPRASEPAEEAPAASTGSEAAAAAALAFVPDANGERWARVVKQMVDAGSIVALPRELAMQSQCLAIDEAARPQRWLLRVERDMLRAPAHGEKLQAALAALLGQAVHIDVELGVALDSPARRDAAERARRQAEAEQIIHNDPLVKALLAQYATARIVPGSVKPH